MPVCDLIEDISLLLKVRCGWRRGEVCDLGLFSNWSVEENVQGWRTSFNSYRPAFCQSLVQSHFVLFTKWTSLGGTGDSPGMMLCRWLHPNWFKRRRRRRRTGYREQTIRCGLITAPQDGNDFSSLVRGGFSWSFISSSFSWTSSNRCPSMHVNGWFLDR